MVPMIEIHYLNGRKRRVPEAGFVADGESMVCVLDVGLEDVSEGLVLYYKHFEPMRPSPGALDVEPDPSGLPSMLYNDGYAVIIEPGDIDKVEKVFYEGKLELFRFSPQGDLVNLHKVNSAQMLYLSEQGELNTRLMIAELFQVMRKAFAEADGGMSSTDEIDAAVCADLGVPETIVNECIDFQIAYALSNQTYAEAHGLPYYGADDQGAEGGGGDGGPEGFNEGDYISRFGDMSD